MQPCWTRSEPELLPCPLALPLFQMYEVVICVYLSKIQVIMQLFPYSVLAAGTHGSSVGEDDDPPLRVQSWTGQLILFKRASVHLINFLSPFDPQFCLDLNKVQQTRANKGRV